MDSASVDPTSSCEAGGEARGRELALVRRHVLAALAELRAQHALLDVRIVGHGSTS